MEVNNWTTAPCVVRRMYVIPYISMIYLSGDKCTMQLAHARPCIPLVLNIL